MAIYSFRMDYIISAQSRPIIIEAECIEDAEEQAFTSAVEAGTAALVDTGTFSTMSRVIEGIDAC